MSARLAAARPMRLGPNACRRKECRGEAITRIKAPIGLDIGAASPAEIAVAVLAEIIGALRRRDVNLPAEGAK